MLKIILGEIPDAVYHPPVYCDNQYEDEWITDPLSVSMIEDIDKSKVIGPHLIDSPALGPISTKELQRTKIQSMREFADIAGYYV